MNEFRILRVIFFLFYIITFFISALAGYTIGSKVNCDLQETAYKHQYERGR